MKNRDILDSWKDIANFLEKDIKTCRRWEKELSLPIHRIDDASSHSKVFAYKSEIDRWLEKKAKNSKNHKKNDLNFFAANKLRIIVGSALFVIALFLSAIYLSNKSSSELEVGVPRIAVLPFTSEITESHDEYVPESFVNELIHLLNSAGTISAYLARASGQDQIMTSDANQGEINWPAEFILTGDVGMNSPTLVFHVQVIQTENQKVIYENTFRCQKDEIFPMQIGMYQKVIDAIGLAGNGSSYSTEAGTRNHNAFDNYLKGNFILKRIIDDNDDPWELYHKGKYYVGSNSRESNELAITLFNEAIKLDENFAQAYIGLANCYTNYVNHNWDFEKKWLEKADELKEKARAISTDFPEYYTTVLQISLIKNIAFGIESNIDIFALAEEGLQVFPYDAALNSITGYCYFMKYGKEGDRADFEKALSYKEKSFWLNPPRPDNLIYVELLMLNKEFYKAIEVCKLINQHNPSEAVQARLGEIYYYLGDLEQSSRIFRQFEEIAALDLKIDSLLFLAMIASQKGLKDEALGIMDEINLISPGDILINGELKMASVYLGMGLKGFGFKYLRDFFTTPIAIAMPFVYRDNVYIDRNFDNFKEDQDFLNILNIKE